MTHDELREKFFTFFLSKGHTVVPSSSLIPHDPSVLFTTAGMQQFKTYYADPTLAPAVSVASIQKCMRTSDIDEVGDASHLTFFEMMGNFSFGGYFKKEAIEFAYEFIVKELGLTIDYVSVFGGEGEIPPDTESEEIWKSIDSSLNIKRLGREHNFWGPTGDEGPCGPTTEIYVDGVEVWNIVFNQYQQQKDLSLKPLQTPGIDTGMGLERLAMAAQEVTTVFETDLFTPVMRLIPDSAPVRVKRIISDHLRASVFMISDGILPSNKDQGYVLRRLLRRMLMQLAVHHGDYKSLVTQIIKTYGSYYTFGVKEILEIISAEDEKFQKTLVQGQRELNRLETITVEDAFKLYESYGLPFEVIKDLGGEKAASLTRDAFDAKFKAHQQKSRSGAEKKFGGHGLLLDTGELKAADEKELKIVTRLHTATHLLQAALRKVLGEGVTQAGSDITAERLRFDFTFGRKLTDDERKQVEDLVNDVITRDVPVTKATMSNEEAKKTGALHFFKMKYPEQVDVYSVEGFSKEFCGGPHVTHTGEIGTFKVIKDEAVSAGVRRIRATVS